LQNNPNRYEYGVFIKGNINSDLLNAFEMVFIQRHNPLFNFTKGGDGALGYKHTLESLEKMSGKNHHLYGKSTPYDIKQKISNTLKGRIISNDHANKISMAMQCHNVSDETKKKMSINHCDVNGDKNPRYRHDVPMGEILFKEWKNGLSISVLAKKYDCSYSLIQRRIRKYVKENNLENERKKIISLLKAKGKNTTGIFRIYKTKDNSIEQGFIWCFYDKEHFYKSVDLRDVKKWVEDNKLDWYIIDEVKARASFLLNERFH
jgi:hypothetical protein